MNRSARLLVAFFTALAVAACNGAAVPATSAPSVTIPSASVGATSTPEPPLVPLDAGLQAMWITQPHPIPGLAPDANAALMALGRTSFGFTARISENGGSEVLSSTAQTMSDGSIRLKLNKDEAGCQAGDAGTYRLTPSLSGLSLAVAPIGDDCGARLAAIGDTTWARLHCPHAPQWCLGEMEAGRHVSINYEPFVRQPAWQPDYGRFAFTVPAGWLTSEDNADGYVLQPDGAPEGTGVYVFSDVLAHAQGKDCPVKPADTVGTSAAAIAAWIQSLPGLAVTNVDSHSSLGGLTGVAMDLALKRAWSGTCEWANGEPLVELFLSPQTPDSGFEWGLNGTGRQRLFVLALGPDRTMVVDIEAGDKPAWDSLLPVAMPIVQSFEFKQ